MSLKIVCSVYLIRHPVGGHTWHHLQYLVGLRRLGHDVTLFEHYGWPDSCYDPGRDVMSSDPGYGIEYMRSVFRRHGLDDSWCYIAEDETVHGISRERLAQACRESDVYLSLSNMNWIPEVRLCRRKAMVDTDPVFTQIGGHGAGGEWSGYDMLFTYGENAGRPGNVMPTGGASWVPTRQPVVLDLWPGSMGPAAGPLTTVMNWSAYGDREYRGRAYGQKNREFETYVTLPHDIGETMELALAGAPSAVSRRLIEGGWLLRNAVEVSRDPWSYQAYLAQSRAEFCVAKHAYVSTQCGWFSDRSCAYLATGRPVVVQDTGFSTLFPCGEGLLAFRSRDEAIAAIRRLNDNYETHCRAARALIAEYFDSSLVLNAMLEQCVS